MTGEREQDHGGRHGGPNSGLDYWRRVCDSLSVMTDGEIRAVAGVLRRIDQRRQGGRSGPRGLRCARRSWSPERQPGDHEQD